GAPQRCEGRDRTLRLPVIRLRPRALPVTDRGYGKRGASLCSSSCTSLNCPYFRIAYRSACRRASSPLKMSNSQRPSSSNHSTRHWPGVARSSKTFAGSVPGWVVFVIMIRAPKNYPNVATLAGLLLRLGPVDRTSRVKVKARTPVERALSMPIERGGADAALRYGFRATRPVFDGAHILLTPPSAPVPYQSQSNYWTHRIENKLGGVSD